MPSSLLSTSPNSVMTTLSDYVQEKSGVGGETSTDSSSLSCCSMETLTLEEFILAIPETIRKACTSSRSKVNKLSDREDSDEPSNRTVERGSEDDPIAALFRRLVLDRDEWDRFAVFDPSKNYTRNLVSTDGETYTLLVLCWNPGRESPIHDHPCDGCWLRICEGSISEARYVRDPETDSLQCTSEMNYSEGQLSYIHDSMGYHKVGNPSKNKPAVTMHLYCPPFQSCRIWLDPTKASRPSRSCVCYHTEYGMPL